MPKLNRNQHTVLRLVKESAELQNHINQLNKDENQNIGMTDRSVLFNALLQLELKHSDKEREEYTQVIKSLSQEEGQELISEIVGEDFHNWNNTKNKCIDTHRDVQKFLEDVFDIDKRLALEILEENIIKKINTI